MSELHNVMEGIGVDNKPGWLDTRYTGTKDALIKAGLAKEYMFADLPKRVKSGWLDCNGWPIDKESIHDDQYDWLGDTRPIMWDTKRVKGGKYKLSIDKSWEEKESLKTPPFTLDSFRELANAKGIAAALSIKIIALPGVSDINPEGYCLSKHHEISQLIGRVVKAVRTSTVIATHEDKPFTIIDGGKI